jgi:hypothetical protein
MDKKSIRINFNFNIAKNKNGRNNSHFKTKHYKNKDIDYIEDYNNIEIFDSVLDAAKSVNDSSTNISRVCKNNSKVSIPRYLCKILLYV